MNSGPDRSVPFATRCCDRPAPTLGVSTSVHIFSKQSLRSLTELSCTSRRCYFIARFEKAEVTTPLLQERSLKSSIGGAGAQHAFVFDHRRAACFYCHGPCRADDIATEKRRHCASRPLA